MNDHRHDLPFQRQHMQAGSSFFYMILVGIKSHGKSNYKTHRRIWHEAIYVHQSVRDVLLKEVFFANSQKFGI